MMYARLQKFLNFCKTKFMLASDTILLGSPYSKKIILHVLIRLSVLNPSTSFFDWEFTVVMFNTKIMLVINGEDVTSYSF